MNKDTGSFDDSAVPPSFALGTATLPVFGQTNQPGPLLGEDWEDDLCEPLVVKGDTIAAFDALVALALDQDTPDTETEAHLVEASAVQAARCLLRVGEALYVAERERVGALFRLQAAAGGGGGGLAR